MLTAMVNVFFIMFDPLNQLRISVRPNGGAALADFLDTPHSQPGSFTLKEDLSDGLARLKEFFGLPASEAAKGDVARASRLRVSVSVIAP